MNSPFGMSVRLKSQIPYGTTARRIGTIASVMAFFVFGIGLLLTSPVMFSEKTSAPTPTAVPVVYGPFPAPTISVQSKKAVRPVSKATHKFNSMSLNPSRVLHRYAYRFEGRATYKGVPCPQANVVVHLSSSQGTKTAGGFTEENGSYAIDLVIEAAADEPVDWTMEAFTRDFHKVQMDGRRIVTKEDTLITVQKPLEFASTRLQ